jgi:hypothetical protein
MWLAIAIILILLWAGGFLLFHIAAFALHVLLIIGAIALIIHLFTSRGRTM